MDGTRFALIFALSLVLEATPSFADPIEDTPPNRRGRRVLEPVSRLFSELGDFFLDVDEAIAVQTRPKVQFEDRILAGLVSPKQPRSQIFKQVQENIQNLQTRLGGIVKETTDRESVGRSANEGLRIGNEIQKVLASLLQPRMKLHPNRLPSSKSETTVLRESSEVRSLDPSENLEKQNDDVSENMQSLRDNILRWANDPRGSEKFREWLRPESNSEFDNQRRLIADVLDSEQELDQNVRSFLKRHGSWFLDNPLLRRWRDSLSQTTTTETSSLPEEVDTTVSTTAEPASSTSLPAEHGDDADFTRRQMSPEETRKSDFYDVDNVIQQEAIDIEMDPESEVSNDVSNFLDSEDRDFTEIVAFSLNGMPLKLKIDSEIEKPVMYLHRLLRAAGTTLYIPVSSFNDLEPAGKEVFSLGVRSGNVNPAYFDLSDDEGRKSFISVLKSKLFTKKRS